MKKILFPAGGAALFAADQILKSYAEQNLEKGEERPLTDRIVLRRVHNKGICWMRNRDWCGHCRSSLRPS